MDTSFIKDDVTGKEDTAGKLSGSSLNNWKIMPKIYLFSIISGQNLDSALTFIQPLQYFLAAPSLT